jgi:RNA polymerase sigma-70 factor (ECF subfamily)
MLGDPARRAAHAAAPADHDAEEADESLMARIQDGDHRAFTVLVRRHSARFYAHAWRMTGNRAEAEDSVQDAFLKLWRNPASFDAGRGNRFTTWFYRVVTNAAIDRQRRKRETADTDALDRFESGAPLQDEALQRDERQTALEAAIAALPERQMAALNLCFYEELSNAEAAEILDVKVKALESLLMRAKATLKQTLGAAGWMDKEREAEHG